MKIASKDFELGKRTYVMGILNITPDSFSDGGVYNELELAIERARRLIECGADIIDVGGESTRPGAECVEESEEISRVIPVIKAIKKQFNIPISIDTYKSKTAEEAIKAGADIINDVWGFKKDKKMAQVAAKYNVPCILMHNREVSKYNNLIEEMKNDLMESVDIAIRAGIEREKIILDPGMGFAKSYEDNLSVMKHLDEIVNLGFPILLGTSRKSMIGLTLNLPPDERIEGTIATTVLGIEKGCDFIRVHDVLENKRAAVMTDRIVRY